MTTTLTIGADDWTTLGTTPAAGERFSFWMARPVLGGNGRVLTVEGWSVLTDATGNATTVIPDAVAGNALVIAPGIPGLDDVYVAGYPTGTLSFVQILAYTVDPGTLDPTPPPAAWWAALANYVKTINGTGPDANGNVVVSGGTGGGAVSSVQGRTGAVVISAADVGAPAASTLGAASGIATLDSSGKLVASQLPPIAISDYLGAAANQAAMLALVGEKGDWVTRTDLGTNWLITGTTPSQLSSWTQLTYPAAPVTQVNGRTGAVTTAAADITDSTAPGRSVLTAASTTAILDAIAAVYASKAVASLSSLSPGWWQHLQLNLPSLAAPTDPESILVESMRGGSLHRAFWLNESGSPRGAAIASEPAMKLFGPEGDHTYAGALLDLFNWWTGAGANVHVWGVNMAGQPLVGTGSAIGSNVILLNHSDTVPAGLPAGTIIARKP